MIPYFKATPIQLFGGLQLQPFGLLVGTAVLMGAWLTKRRAREAGIPVESVRGPYGGYRLGRGLRLPPLVFSAAEALGLVMAVLDGRHAAAESEDPIGSGLGKIIRALPVSVGRQAATMQEHVRAVPDRWSRPDSAITSALVEAVGELFGLPAVGRVLGKIGGAVGTWAKQRFNK